MAQKDLFNRYIWLLDLIYRSEGITREEINRYWRVSRYNHNNDKELSERTFHRYKNAIEEIFDVEIVCDRHGDKTYHVAGRDGLKLEAVKGWLLSTFAVNNIVAESRDLKDRILLEPVPMGQQYLNPIIEAMRDGKVIDISYQSFHMDAPKQHLVEPYCLKIYKQRWYLLGRRADTKAMRIFALDRIKGIVITGKSFNLPASFDAENYFAGSIGIIVEADCNPQTITISARGGQQDYLRSLPLHDTQTEIETSVDESKFTLFAQPNYDLIQELLRYGEDVTVLRPKWFRDEFRKIASKMNKNYSED